MNFFNYSTDSAFITGTLIGLIIGGLLYFFYLKNLYDLLKAVREPNRKMSPNGIWLIFMNSMGTLLSVPVYYLSYDNPRIAILFTVLVYLMALFVVIWHFKIVNAVAASIEAEYDSRNIPIEYRPSYQTGTFMAVSGAVMLLNEVPYVGFLGRMGSLAFLIGWIAYWVRTRKYKKELQAMPLYQDEDSLIFKDLY